MKVNDWSAVGTADNKGVAIKHSKQFRNDYEICIDLNDKGDLEINIYNNFSDNPIVRTILPTGETQ